MSTSEIHPSRYRLGRSGVAPNLIVVHDSEGPYSSTAAVSLKRWMATDTSAQGNFASYHAASDHTTTVEMVSPQDTAFGAGGVNQRALHWCICGAAAANQPNSIPYPGYLTTAGGQGGTGLVAAWCAAFAIPAVKLTPEQVRDGAAGICGHGDVSVYHPTSGGHTDPGSRFPWPAFLTAVRLLLAPEEDDMASGDLIEVTDHPKYPPGLKVMYVSDPWGVEYRWIQSEAHLVGVKADRAKRGQSNAHVPCPFADLGRYGVLVGAAP